MNTPHRARIGHNLRCSLIALTLGAASAFANPPADYELVFEENFDGSSLDPAIWHIDQGPRKDAVNVADAIEVSGGQMSITTYTQDNQSGTANDVHHTAMISTADRFLHPFGYYEARIRFDQGAVGAWHAFWLMPGGTTPNWGANDDPETGAEIDIIEYRHERANQQDLTADMHCALHWNGYGSGHQKDGTDPDPQPLGGASLLDGQFHTYSVLWTPTKYEFYFDGTKVWETTNGLSFAYSHLILSSEVKSNYWWAGNAPEDGYGAKGAASNPKFTVDWVRVYNQQDSASGQSAFAANTIPGTLEAEDFDDGGDGVSHYDKDDSGPGNHTGYRNGTDVDLDANAAASNGFHIAEPTENEWLEHTIHTTQPGIYSVEVDVARAQDPLDHSDNGIMRFYADGEAAGEIRIDDTGGWTSWHRQSIPCFLYLEDGSTFTTRFGNRRDLNYDAIHFEYLGNVVDAREAESGAISGLTTIGSELASGGQFVSGFGQVGVAHSVEFSEVEGFTGGGDVTMTLRYAWPQSNPNKTTGVKVKVNGVFLQDGGADLILPLTDTRSWNHYHNLSLTLPGMNPGAANTVMLVSDAVSNQNIRLDSVIFTRTETLPTEGGATTGIEAEQPGNVLLGDAGTGTHHNASNGAYVDGLNKSSSGVEFPGVSAGGGPATITIHYANGSGGQVTKALEVNGVAQDVDFPATSAWNDFTGSVQATVTLTGNDTIRIYRKDNTSADQGALRVDKIVIETSGSANISEYTEAEALMLLGQAETASHGSASNGTYVTKLNKSASGVEWTVNAPAAMQATLTIGYANGSGSDSLKMLNVNGADNLLTFPATAGWNDYTGQLQVTVNLQAGANTIKLWRDGAGIDSLRVDWLDLSN